MMATPDDIPIHNETLLTNEHKMMVKEILYKFDFDKVSKFIKYLRETDTNIGYDLDRSTPDQLYATAKRQLVDAIASVIKNNFNEYHISGVFDVSYYPKLKEDDRDLLTLKFVVEESDSDGWNTL